MSEEVKNIRLNKVAKEFNVGVSRIVEFLAKKGHHIENNPNTKISGEVYELLSKAFHSERTVKENADKIEIVAPVNKSVVIEASQVVENVENSFDDFSKEPKDVFIKDYVEVAPPQDNADSDNNEEDKEPKDMNSATTDATESSREESVEDGSYVEQKEPDFEPQIIHAAVSSENTGNDVFKAELRIVNKIDLDALNTKSRPDKKARNEKEQERIDRKEIKEAEKKKAAKQRKEKEEKAKREKAERERQEKERAEKVEKERQEKERVEKAEMIEKADKAKQQTTEKVEMENPRKDFSAKSVTVDVQEKNANEVAATVENKSEQATKEVEFIETQYQKLTGPKVVTKIDLSQFDKPKGKPEAKAKPEATDAEKAKKKKRKRLKKEALNVEGAQTAATSNKQGDKKSKNKQNNSNPNANANATTNKDKKTKDVKDKKVKDAKKKPEIDDAEIEKQIKETLARLNPMGKSKTSKHRREKRQNVHQQIEEEQLREAESQKILKVTEFVTANELATMMNIPVTKIIATCMAVGMFVSINQRLDAEAIQLIADEFGYQVDFVSADLVDAIHEIEETDKPEDLVMRNPVVTVMGHVDHGKTSLLDYIRNSNVIAGEAGGITQHIGAYEVTTADGRKITFLDTPGHEAFTAMRARGAKITDIAIIVVAADDRVMPQTIEAINHAQAANVPIVFAINKIDKPAANPDKIKEELANMNLLVEEWGGKYQSQDISAKKGLNVDLLLEKVLLEAEILELKGNPNKRAKGTILESSLDKGRGYVAKILVQDGTIHQGDFVLAGSTYGRVKAMYNERNQIIKEAGPSSPVLLLGLNGAPQAGDTFNVMETEKEAKDIASKRFQLQREQGIRTQKHITLDEIGRRIAIGDFKQLNLIVKGDVDGSVEALSDSLLKLSTEEVQVNVVHKAVGQITESDVLLATASNAIIIGFQVRPSVQARKLAETEQIDIRLYSIIYTAINELKDAIEGMLSPEIQEKIVANLEIRETFKIAKVGTIAGCMCLDGKIIRSNNVRIIRDGIVVYTGKLASLKCFKDDVKEVVAGQDCGLSIENFNDVKAGDIVEAYEEIEIKRKL